MPGGMRRQDIRHPQARHRDMRFPQADASAWGTRGPGAVRGVPRAFGPGRQDLAGGWANASRLPWLSTRAEPGWLASNTAARPLLTVTVAEPGAGSQRVQPAAPAAVEAAQTCWSLPSTMTWDPPAGSGVTPTAPRMRASPGRPRGVHCGAVEPGAQRAVQICPLGAPSALASTRPAGPA